MTKTRSLVTLIALAFLLAGCGSKKADVGAAEQKVAEAQKQLEQAKTQAGAEQRVAELEKQLEEAKKEMAAASGEAAAPAAPAPAAAPAEPPPPPKPIDYVIPANTTINVRTTTPLSTKTAATGAAFAASLMEPIVVDGATLAAAGAEVDGVVVLSDPGGKVKGKASISVTLKSIAGKHGPIAIQTNNREAIAKSTVKKDVARGGIMTGAGAAIGAIAGGGKGAAIGAGIGGAAGVGTAMATKGAPAEFPAESALTFTLKAPVTITVQP
jgi:hypothetical protein